MNSLHLLILCLACADGATSCSNNPTLCWTRAQA